MLCRTFLNHAICNPAIHNFFLFFLLIFLFSSFSKYVISSFKYNNNVYLCVLIFNDLPLPSLYFYPWLTPPTIANSSSPLSSFFPFSPPQQIYFSSFFPYQITTSPQQPGQLQLKSGQPQPIHIYLSHFQILYYVHKTLQNLSQMLVFKLLQVT